MTACSWSSTRPLTLTVAAIEFESTTSQRFLGRRCALDDRRSLFMAGLAVVQQSEARQHVLVEDTHQRARLLVARPNLGPQFVPNRIAGRADLLTDGRQFTPDFLAELRNL